MTTHSISIDVTHAVLAELAPEQLALCDAAREATKLSYSPYSNFRVGCAARLDGVEGLVLAANLENAAYPQCICAEAALLARVHAQYPGHTISELAIAVDGPAARAEGAGPCGSCRQQLFEAEIRQAGAPIKLYLIGADDSVRVLESCGSLLPLGFTL